LLLRPRTARLHHHSAETDVLHPLRPRDVERLRNWRRRFSPGTRKRNSVRAPARRTHGHHRGRILRGPADLSRDPLTRHAGRTRRTHIRRSVLSAVRTRRILLVPCFKSYRRTIGTSPKMTSMRRSFRRTSTMHWKPSWSTNRSPYFAAAAF